METKKDNSPERKESRDGFTSKFGVLVAVAGSAVGLGNLWRFPYMVGTHGGAAFILLYLLFVIVICLPIMFSEFIIGRRTQSNVFGAFRKLAPGTAWPGIGFLSVLAALCIMAFYSVVGGWTLKYIELSITGVFSERDSSNTLETMFNHFIASPVEPLFWHLLFLCLSGAIVFFGIKNGIEKYSKILMPVLFFMVMLLAVRALMLPGAGAGVEYLFKPDFSKITGEVALAALGQAFFSLSLGMGCVITYGSYVKKNANLINTSFKVMLADTGFALLAGLAIMPAVFAFGIAPGEGPSLVFITVPKIFMQLPFGTFFSVVFFIVLMVAALTSAISLLEVITAYLKEEFHIKRGMAVGIAITAIGILGAFSSLSQGSLSDVTIFGKNIFDMFDYLSSNILLPLGGLLIVLFVGWKMKRTDVYDELTNGGSIRMHSFNTVLFLLKYIIPVAIAIILINSAF